MMMGVNTTDKKKGPRKLPPDLKVGGEILGFKR